MACSGVSPARPRVLSAATNTAALAVLLLLLSAAADERRSLFGAPGGGGGGGGGGGWWWRCEKGRCVRSPEAAGGAGGAAAASLPLCRLTCGAAGALWPRPTGSVALGKQLAPLHPRNIRVDVQCSAGPEQTRFLKEITNLLSETLSRECRVPPLPANARTNAFAHPNAYTPANAAPAYAPANASCALPLLVVELCTSEPALTLRFSTNESYSLRVRSDGCVTTASAEAASVFGARHALESLAQLTACDAAEAAPMRIVAQARVDDAPRLAHRGLLLDTARHWLPERALRRTIDAMAASKLNVLHWHATDSHSFPLLLPRAPQLARWGAYSPSQTYSAGSISRLAAYARARGVRLLLELDAPAHAGAGWQWGAAAGLGNLTLCYARTPYRDYCIQPPCGQFNPVNDHVYSLLADVYADLLEALPPGEQMHLGGDEVFIPCWNKSKEVVQWLEQQGRGRSKHDFLVLWSEFHARQLAALEAARARTSSRGSTRADHHATALDRKPLLWSSHLTDPADVEDLVDKERFSIHTWVEKGSSLAEKLMDKGYHVVVTVKDAWYLDHGFWGNTRYYTWRDAYNARLPAGERLLGGEAAMWGELVDEQALDARVWPRAAAAAERLWSDPEDSTNDAEPRLLQLRERLVRRGVRAAAVTPQWCYLNEGLC